MAEIALAFVSFFALTTIWLVAPERNAAPVVHAIPALRLEAEAA